MAVQINVAANQAALTASIQAGVQAYNQKFAQNNQVNLSVNQRAFSQPLGRMTGDVKDFEAALAASNARVIAFGASTAVLGGVIRSFKELANVTIDVEKNLADINRVFGLTTSQLQKFSTDLFSVGKQTASSFDDASKAALEFSRQGLKAEEVLIRTKDALTLARVAGISTANSVDALTSTINGFAATGVTTTQILNKLVAVEQDFAVGAGDLAEALSRTGQAAQEAGVSLDQLNALVTAAQQSTARGGAVIGNALKTIFTRLQRTETLDQLEAFNIAVRDVQGNTLPAVTVLQNFAGAYKNLGDAQRAQLSEQVAGVYQVNILKAIVGDLNKSQGVYAGALQRGASATNEAEVATAKLNQTLDALLKQTATSTQQLANNIGKVTFEPLARYGTEQLKSLVESMNEILEGEGVGSTFANGLLKGIRNVIAGPGAIAAFFTLFKLIQNSFTYLAQALPQIAGITTETQNRKNIEQSILQIMQQQGPVSQALAGSMGNQAAQAQLLLQLARQQTAEYQIQSTLAKQLATQLAGQGVRVKGSGGLQATRAGGYIPNATRMAEAVGAQAGGYAPGKVVKSPVGGVMNTAEDVKYVPGFAQPFINPPAGSKAGRAHRQNAISRTGVDPYMNGGFIPNFVKKASSQFAVGRAFEKNVGFDIDVPPSWNNPVDFNEVLKKPVDKNFNPKLYQSNTFADAHSGLGHTSAENISKVINHIGQNYYSYSPTQGSKTRRLKIDDKTSIISQPDLLGDLFIRPRYTEIIGEGSDVAKQTETSSVSSLNDTAKKTLLNGVSELDSNRILKRKIKMQFAQDRVYGSGFIPNFAPPTSAMRVPWFKKFGNAAFDNIQPTLGISKANDLDTFRQINFRTNAKGADKVGDSNIFAPLYEDFVFKAMQLVSQSKVKDQLIRGYALQPGTDQKQSAFDAFLGDTALEYKGFPKGNITGSISQTLNDKYERFAKANPAGAAKIKESVITFNELGHENQLPSEFGKTFSQLAGTSYSQMAKSSPDLVKALSAETNSLLNNYVKNPAFLAMNAAKGFMPNFASMISSSIKGKGNISAVKTGKNNYEIEGVEVGKKFRGQGLGSQLYGSIAEKIGSGSTIKSVLLPQEQALADYASGKSIPAKAIFPQLSWAKRAKSSKLLINGKEIAMSDFESGIAGHKYNAAKLDMALIELVNSHASGSIPNFADLIDVDTLGKNSVHYSGDLMKLIKDIESSVGRHLTSGELRFLTHPKTNLSKLNDPKILNRFINSERNGFAGFAKGFLPNFAYKQAVMGLEESMSGEKAVFDTKPFPHIRNKSQPTFSSAIADHGGLSNALSDSMRGQKNAGLMNGGFMPNFGTVNPNAAFGVGGLGALTQAETLQFNKLNAALSKLETDTTLTASQMKALKTSIRLEARSLSASTGVIDIVTETNKALGDSIRKNIAAQRASTSATASNNKNNNNSTGFFQSNMLTAMVAPILGSAIASQAAFGDKKRYELTEKERMTQNFANTGVTSISTGAAIGTMLLPGWGTAIGAAVGGLIAFSEATKAAKLTIGELKEKISDTATKQTDLIRAYKTSVENLISVSQSGGDTKAIDSARTDLATSLYGITTSNLKDLIPAEGKSVDLKGLEAAILDVNRKADSQTSALSATEKLSSGGKEISMMDRIIQNLSETILDFTEDVSHAFDFLGDGIKTIMTSVLKDIPFTKTIDYLNKGFTGFFDYLTSGIERMGLIFTQVTRKFGNEIELIAFEIKNLLNPFRNPHDKAREENALFDKQAKSKQLDTEFDVAMQKNYVKNAAAKVNMFLGSVGLMTEALGGVSGGSETSKAVDAMLKKGKNLKDRVVSGMGERKPQNFDMEKIVAEFMNAGGAKSVDFFEKFKGDSQIQDFATRIGSEPSTRKRDEEINNMLTYVKNNKVELLEDATSLAGIFRKMSETNEFKGQFILANFLKFVDKLSELRKSSNAVANTIGIGVADFSKIKRNIEEAFIKFNNMTDLKQVGIEGAYERGKIGREEAIKRTESFGKPFDAARQRFESDALNRQESFRKENVKSDMDLVSVAAGLAKTTNAGQPTFDLNKLSGDLQDTNTPFEKRAQDLENFIKNQKNFLNADNEQGLQAIARAKSIAAISKEKNKEDEKTANLVYSFEIKRLQEARNFKLQLKEGFSSLSDDADVLVGKLGRDLPHMFGDGLVSGIKAAIKESDNLGDALMGVAANFLDSISTTLMQASVYKLLGSVGVEGLIPKQKGGYIRAQSGTYISGTGTGDKYPAMLENGEYVLNRRAVMAMGGPASLDKLNFADAPRFASGGSFGNEFTDLKSMESNMTTYGMENSKLYGELRDAEVSAAEERRRKAFAKKQQMAAMIGSAVAAVASYGIGAGISNKMGNIQAGKAQTLSAKLNATGGAGMTNSELGSLAKFQKSGLLGNNFEYKGPTNIQSGFNSFLSGPSFGPNRALVTKSMGRQTGGSIGSRLSDTIPGYMEGGLYNTPIVKNYGVGMQSGGSSPTSNSNSNVVNTTNATNAFNFNTNVSRDGTIEVGSNSTSYAQQDVELSKNLNSKVYAVVLNTIKNEQRFGGSLAGTRQG
jgi:TP901 family phage tail tape measure protein